MDPDSEGWQLPRGGVPADSPPKAGTAVAGEGLERLEALHQVVEERPARCQLGLVALPQNLPASHPTLTRCPTLHCALVPKHKGPVQ